MNKEFNFEKFADVYRNIYDYLYDNCSDEPCYSEGFKSALVKIENGYTEQVNKPIYKECVQEFSKNWNDIISSDREVTSFILTMNYLKYDNFVSPNDIEEAVTYNDDKYKTLISEWLDKQYENAKEINLARTQNECIVQYEKFDETGKSDNKETVVHTGKNFKEIFNNMGCYLSIMETFTEKVLEYYDENREIYDNNYCFYAPASDYVDSPEAKEDSYYSPEALKAIITELDVQEYFDTNFEDNYREYKNLASNEYRKNLSLDNER